MVMAPPVGAGVPVDVCKTDHTSPAANATVAVVTPLNAGSLMVMAKEVLVALFRKVKVRVFPAPGAAVSCAYNRKTFRGMENGNCARDSLAMVCTVP